MIETLKERVNGDEALVRRGRYLTTTFLLEVGQTAWLISIFEGRVASVTHRDPAKAAILEGLRSIDIPCDGPLLQSTLNEASIQIVTDVSALMPGLTREAREAADILKRVNLDSMVIMPVIMGDRTTGVGVLGRDDDRPRVEIHLVVAVRR